MEDTIESQYGVPKIIIGGIVAFVLLMAFLLFKPFTIVGAGERGVVMHFGKVQQQILGEGLHFYVPIYTSVRKISVRVLKDDVKAEAASKDLQIVNVDIVVNWHLDPTKVNSVYQNVGDNKAVLDNIIAPAISEVAKASTAQKTAEEIITKRPELKADIDERLIARLAPYGIVLTDISLVNVDFSKEFNSAIEAKQVAEQDAKRAVFIAQKAEQEALAVINKAKGDAEGQRLQQQTLTPALLQKLALEQWDGHLPTYMGSGVLPFLDIK